MSKPNITKSVCNQTKEPLAVVGIGCRLPGGANSAEALWQGLINRVDGIVNVPTDRWNADVFYDPDPAKFGRIKNRQGGFIKDIDKFDAEFFGYFAEEAAQLDPQQRMALEVACEALEDAGEVLENIQGSRTSVFISGFLYDHLCMQLASGQRDIINPYAAMGVGVCSLANRISYCLNLKGPSVAVDTACSGSLVALHLACRSIWNGEADAALAGGVNALLKPESSIVMSKAGFLSPDARCKAFDVSANGYVRSEGSGIVYIKPLSKALDDNDDIYGVIRGSAVNQDGYTPAGFTVPDREAQVTMLKSAYADAGVNPADVVYVEAHGPGTPVGDPIETSALGEVIGKGRAEHDKYLVGSIKTNIGHLEGASGIAGFIKASLVVKNRSVPPNLHFNHPNPAIDFDAYRISVPTENLPLGQKSSDQPIVAVNSFGAGGTNAHVVLQGVINTAIKQDYTVPNDWVVFLISARSLVALKAYANKYIDYLNTETDAALQDISLAQFTRRSRHEHQLFILGRTREHFIQSLNAFINDEREENSFYYQQERVEQPKLAFMYSGQGGQWAEMGVTLMQSEPVFMQALNEFDHAFKTVSGWSVVDEINKPESSSTINETTIVQPAIVAVQIALTKLLEHYGVRADGIVGHSIGEVSAAYAAGAISLEQAASVIYHRARIQDKASGKGRMLAIAVSADDAASLVEPHKDSISIATINGPGMVTLAGDEKPLQEIAQKLESQGVFNRFVNVKVPYHSHYMEPLKDELIETLDQYRASDIVVPLYSTVSTRRQKVSDINGEYWYLNVRNPVRFVETIETMLNDDYNLFVEIGPHPVLATGVKDIIKAANKKAQVAVSMNRKTPRSQYCFFDAVTAWLSAGNTIAGGTKKSRSVKLPGYPWQHQRYWYESPEEMALRTTDRKYPFVKQAQRCITDDSYKFWELGLGLGSSPYLSDHRVDGSVVYPAAAHMMMAFAVARDMYNHDDLFLHGMRFENALLVPDGKNANLDVRLEVTNAEGAYTICSRNAEADSDTPWSIHSHGKINALRDDFHSRAPDIRELKAGFADGDKLDVEQFYNTIRDTGLYYGKTFQCIKEMWIKGNEVLARLELDESLEIEAGRYLVHPSLYDAHLQMTFADQQQNGDPSRVYLPNSIGSAKVHRPATTTTWAYVTVNQNDETWLCSDHWLFDNEMNLVSELHGMAAKSIPSAITSDDVAHQGCAEYSWEKVPLREHGIWTGVVEGDLLHVVVVCENNNPFVDQLLETIKAARPEVNTHRFSMESGIDALSERFPLDRRTQVIYVADTHPGDIEPRINTVTDRVVKLTQKIIEQKAIPSIFLITQQATLIQQTQVVEVVGADKSLNIAHTPLFGMARVMANEYPSLPVRVIDIDSPTKTTIDSLCEELLCRRTDIMESEIALRGADRFVRHLRFIDADEIAAKAAENMPACGSPYQAHLEQTGVLGEVSFRRIPENEIHADEVEIKVKAAALNYKDVMNAMGLLAKRAVAGGLAGDRLGLEVAGVVTAVGGNVTEVKAGDEVMARVANGFAGQCVTPSNCVIRKPDAYSFEQAAAVPVVYLTAHYGLNYLGRMEKDETVLIHSATGGVGIAAIHLAKAAGATVIATAGTRKKRTYLRKEFGIKHVFDSRSNSFYDEVMQATEGRGVDLVLNSLTGKLIIQGLKCLAPYGRFIELGKTDIYGNTALSMERLAENISYHVVDVDRLAAQKPQLHKTLFEQVAEKIVQHSIPAHPITTYPVSELGKALKQMTRATHVGKLVVSMDEELHVLPQSEFRAPASGAIIVTGGASGLGLRLAEWLSQKGARQLVLASRSGCKSDVDQAIVDDMIAAGVDVRMQSVDVNDKDQVKKLVREVNQQAGSVAGVVHAAGVLDDALIPNMTSEKFMHVFKPKALGAWNLHEALVDEAINPDIFLMISSMSSVLGLKGQVNYAAANYFEDALAEYRQNQGMNAVSVNLGVLGEYAGMSMKEKDDTGVLELLDTHGLGSMKKADVLAKIEAVLIEKPSHRLAASIRWKEFGLAYPNLVRDSKLVEIFSEDSQKTTGASRNKGMSIREELAGLEQEQQQELLATKLATAISELTGMALETISTTESIDKWSLDSIMLGQISAWILKHTEINYPLIKLVKGPSLQEISLELLPQLQSDAAGTEAASSDRVGVKDDGTLLLEMGAQKLSDWIIRGVSSGNESKRIICFHSMGVGASLYTHFLLNPPEDTDILAIQLPGRENRAEEVFLQNVDEIVDHALEEIKPYLDKPFMVWGHSFGGVIAFETIRRLRADKLDMPGHLMLTATIAPHLIRLWQNRDAMLRVLVEENRAQYLTSLSRYIEDPEFIERILPVMRRDMPILQSYKYREQDNLNMPITTWAAQQDDVVYLDEVEQWNHHTDNSFEVNVVDGDHWFLNSNKDAITRKLGLILDTIDDVNQSKRA